MLMKIDKEYPATHSMSTAWYVADEEGNVAIMNYEDNGPVPWGIEDCVSIEDLVFGHFDDYTERDFISIDLTDDQIDDLMENPHQPEDEDFWGFCIFQIDLEHETEFLELAKNGDIRIEFCISKKRGLYSVYCSGCSEKSGNKYVVKKSSTLEKMIDRGMIKQIYNAKRFEIDEMCDEDALASVPYFIYQQDYDEDYLPERLNIPERPVKLDQFPPDLRDRVHRVPIKFRECRHFQIAEWVPSYFYRGDTIEINGCNYHSIVLTNGTKSYVCTSKRGLRFIDYCSERAKYGCKECTDSCFTVQGNELFLRPTVMYVFHPFGVSDYGTTITSDTLIKNSVRIPLLHKVPFKDPSDCYMSESEAMDAVTEDMLTNFFLKNYKHFEDTVIRFNPRVIIIEERAISLLGKLYAIDERSIKIRGQLYPYYLRSEVKKNKDEITKLSLFPYRGIEMPYIISEEEMAQYRKNDESD